MPADTLIPANPPERSPASEFTNTLTHGIGFILSLAAGAALLIAVWSSRDVWRIGGCTIYAAALIGVYACSTLSHAVSDQRRKVFFRRLDQGFIYLLIVGTYTPFSVSYLRGFWWSLFLASLWSVALAGCLAKILWARRVNAVSLWLYVLLGWAPIVTAEAMIGRVPSAALWWMLIGGLCYTLGTVFLVLDRHWHHLHAVWHICVIAGSAWHFFAILFFIALPS